MNARRPATTVRLLGVWLTTGVLTACLGGPTGSPGRTSSGSLAPTASGSLAVSSAPIGSPAQSGSSGATTPPSPAGTTTLVVYLLANERLIPAQRGVATTLAVGSAALRALIAGPTPAEAGGSPALTSSVPSGSALIGLDISNGLATVDLSREFETGGGAGRLSALARLAQVVYTLTQFQTVERVIFRLDGRPVSLFSAEGIVLDRPSIRGDFQSLLPPIFVDRPAWGGTPANPARLAGLANVFEATFQAEIRDAGGRTLAKRQVMASCGTGCWGTFDVSIPYPVGAPQPGQVVVYSLSAKDGSVINQVAYPVTLIP